jgi:putative endonuclease
MTGKPAVIGACGSPRASSAVEQRPTTAVTLQHLLRIEPLKSCVPVTFQLSAISEASAFSACRFLSKLCVFNVLTYSNSPASKKFPWNFCHERSRGGKNIRRILRPELAGGQKRPQDFLSRAEPRGKEFAKVFVCFSAMYFCYILECADGSYYVGVAEDPERRLEEYNSGRGANWTIARRPARLVWTESHPTLSAARTRENQMVSFREPFT